MIPFTTTASSKGPLIEALALALERGELAILPDAALLSELGAYRLERLPSGRFRYGAPPGAHDDCCDRAGAAWHGAQQGGGGISFVYPSPGQRGEGRKSAGDAGHFAV